MGWSGGSLTAERVWSLFRPHVPKTKREAVAKKLVRIFEAEDCDTMYEAEQLMHDAGLDTEDED